MLIVTNRNIIYFRMGLPYPHKADINFKTRKISRCFIQIIIFLPQTCSRLRAASFLCDL